MLGWIRNRVFKRGRIETAPLSTRPASRVGRSRRRGVTRATIHAMRARNRQRNRVARLARAANR